MHPLATLVAILLCAGDPAIDRVGLRDACDTPQGWVVGRDPRNPGGQAPKSMVGRDGMLVVDTVRGGLSGDFSAVYNKFGIQTGLSGTALSRAYGTIDLDRYPFLVVRLHSNQTFAMLSVNNRATKVLYTTGLHAQDLRELGLHGTQPIGVQIILTNTTGRFVLDELRLVSELTPEERNGLIPRGFAVRSQGLTCPPYQGLQALFDRGRAPLVELRRNNELAGGEGRAEWAVFHDQATGAPVARLTRYPGTEWSSEFSANGRYVRCRSNYHPGIGDHIYDLRTHTMSCLPEGKHFFDPRDGNTSILIDVEHDREGTGGRIRAHRCDLATGRLTPIVDQHVDSLPRGGMENAAFGRETSRFVIGFRENDVVFVFNPEATGAERMRRVKLPYPIKGLGLANHDREIVFAACYTYHTLRYDLDTGSERLQPRWWGGSHTAMGETRAMGAYGRVAKIVVPVDLVTDQPGDAIRLHGNYDNCQVPVDYGTVSPDGRWAFQDGHGKGPVDLDGQIVGFDLCEGGNVIPIWFYQGSRSNWGILPYLKVSPDSTKLLLQSSDMLGSGDIYVTPFQRPEPPGEVNVERAERGLRITWKTPVAARELWGYHVYQSLGRGLEFRRVNPRLVIGNEFLHAPAQAQSVYLVTAVDNSGLESRLPAPAMLADRPRDDGGAVFLEAECADHTALPFRRQYDGSAANFGTMRLMSETRDEIEGQLRFTLSAERFQAHGNRRYAVALRCRVRSDIYPESAREEAGVEIHVDRRVIGRTEPRPGPGFAWCSCAGLVDLAPGPHELAIRSKTAGVEVDRVAVFDALVERSWLARGDRDPEPELALTVSDRQAGLTAQADGPYAIELQWPAAKDVHYYSVYASAHAPAEIGNATLLGSTRQNRFRDAGLRPATALEYCAVGYDTRGRAVVSHKGHGRSAAGPQPVTLRLPIARATIDGGLERGQYEGRPLVRAARRTGPAGPGKATFTVDIPKTGDYAIWFYGRSRRPGVSTFAAVDQTTSTVVLNGYVDPSLIPGLDRERAAPWLAQRLVMQPRALTGPGLSRDVFSLMVGRHTIALGMGPTDARGVSDEFGDLILTNDLTWTPDDYDARRLFHLAK